jgi:hypothetical protein
MIRQRLVYHAGMTARRIELIAAAACVALAILGTAYALFGPTVSVSTQSSVAAQPAGDPPVPETVVVTEEDRSMYDDGVEPAAALYLALMLVLAAGVAALAFAHGRSWVTRSATPLWAAAASTTLLALLAGFSIGLFFLPVALAAIVAAAAASRYAAQLRG